MYNALTGGNQYVGNWPGVTVEKKEGKLKGHESVIITDLPGIYSLSPYTPEEVVSRNYLTLENPNVIINVVDSTNIERNLYLTTQLAELKIPIIIALNMTDIIKKAGDKINVKKLSEYFGCPTLEISALKGEGCIEASQTAILLAENNNYNYEYNYKSIFSEYILEAIQNIENLIKSSAEKQNKFSYFYAVKLFERDKEVKGFSEEILNKAEQIIKDCEAKYDDDSEGIIANERYTYITKIVEDCVFKKNKGKPTMSNKIDNIITNRILALPIFAAVMFILYFVSVSMFGALATDFINNVLFGQLIVPYTEKVLVSLQTADWFNSLILNGIFKGVGSVVSFLPQLLVLFFFLSLLEDCGYMARIAFILDKVFRKFGLSGKSFIPILIGTGCGVPGIMASRTIESEADRKITIITTTFIPCSAKLPIIALIAGALFPNSAWVAFSAYFIGILSIMLSGIILKQFKAFKGKEMPFVMELPPYRMPRLKNILLQVYDRGKSFVQKASTVILIACVGVWFLSTFNLKLEFVEIQASMLASFGRFISPVFSPLGFGQWQAAVSTLTGLIAKENVVGTLSVLYGGNIDTKEAIKMSFNQLSAYSFMLFNLLCAPCVAAIGAIGREMGSVKWTLAAVLYQTAFAFLVSLAFYQIGRLLIGNF